MKQCPNISSLMVIKVHLIGAFVRPEGGGGSRGNKSWLSVICYVAFILGPTGRVTLHWLVVVEDLRDDLQDLALGLLLQNVQ